LSDTVREHQVNKNQKKCSFFGWINFSEINCAVEIKRKGPTAAKKEVDCYSYFSLVGDTNFFPPLHFNRVQLFFKFDPDFIIYCIKNLIDTLPYSIFQRGFFFFFSIWRIKKYETVINDRKGKRFLFGSSLFLDLPSRLAESAGESREQMNLLSSRQCT
jgi:hypothetical protein